MPTPLAQPVDWNPVYNYGATTDTTIVPFSSDSETYINPIGNGLHQVFLPSEVSDLIREGLQLGLQQRAKEECREQIWQRVLEARARVEEKLNHEEGIPLRHPPFPNLVPQALPLVLSYVIASLLLGLENLLGYLHVSVKITFTTSHIVPTICRVPHFEAPIHVPRPRNPFLRPPPPYIRGSRVILEDETDESLSS